MPVATIGPVSVMTVLLIALVVLGPKRATELGRSAIKALVNFREAVAGDQHPVADAPDDPTYSQQRRVGSGNRTS